MRIALGQINTKLADFDFNSKKIIDACNKSYKEGFEAIAFPELSLLGYAPNDLLERPELLKLQNKYLRKIVKETPSDLGIFLGCLSGGKKQLFNSCCFIYQNKIQKDFSKTLLPTYDVFDEKRHFSSGDLSKNIIKFKNKKILIGICEDLWGVFYKANPLEKIKTKIDIVVSINSSPFFYGKQKKREKIITDVSKTLKAPVYYVNQVGAQDELIFDGGSFSTDKNGRIVERLAHFTETTSDLKSKKTKRISKFAALEKALVLGIRDYFLKTGFKKAHLGLSGGIDSALVLYLAVKALGSKNVTGIALPGPYSSKLSFKLAEKLSKNLGSKFLSHDINPGYKTVSSEFEKTFGSTKFGLMQENLQARLRALNLMAFSNKENSLLLATSNKSELCVGYSTLYGDQCGAIMPIGDLLKTEVFDLCEWINREEKVIPTKIITRPPSAELRPNQKDSDSLPDYKLLDASIEKIITFKKAPSSDLDHWVLKQSYKSEFKRWQAAPILKVSEHAFGIGRRMPITHQAKTK